MYITDNAHQVVGNLFPSWVEVSPRLLRLSVTSAQVSSGRPCEWPRCSCAGCREGLASDSFAENHAVRAVPWKKTSQATSHTPSGGQGVNLWLEHTQKVHGLPASRFPVLAAALRAYQPCAQPRAPGSWSLTSCTRPLGPDLVLLYSTTASWPDPGIWILWGSVAALAGIRQLARDTTRWPACHDLREK